MRVFSCMVLALLIATGVAAQDGKLYKWVDEDGNVTYQDRPPPDGGGQVETFADQGPEETPETSAPDVDVTLYSIEVCDACDLLRKLLRDRGVAFEEKNAQDNLEVQNELKEVAGALSVPVLQIGDQVLKGYNRELVLNELEEAGFATQVVGSTAPGSEEASGQDGQADAATGAEAADEATDEPVEDDDLSTFDDDIFSEEDINGGSPGGDVTEWEEIPEDERIDVNQ